MSFGGANISTGWLAGLGPAGTTTTSRIINANGKILVVGNSSDNFTIQGFNVRGTGDGGQFIICFNTSGVVQWVQSPVVGLPVPTSLAVTAYDGQAVVNWACLAKELLTGYQVDVSGKGVFSVVGSSVTSLDVSGLVNKTTYPVRVRAVNATKQSDYSAAVNVRPMPVPPTPTGLSALTIAKKSIDVSWNISNSNFVDGYTIDVNGVLYDVNDGSARTYRVTGLLTDTTYTLKIRSYNNAYTSSYTPSISYTVPFIAVAPTAYKTIAYGGAHAGAVLADGTIRTWGAGANGRLGIATIGVDMSTAVTPCNISNAVALACGNNYTAVLLADGTMRTWGSGGSGRLGIRTINVDMSTAVTPCNLSNVVAIACGNDHAAALLENGTMRTWGFNGFGRLGIGNTADMSTAVTPCNISNAVAIACGPEHTAALLSDGTMRTWGGGASGGLGYNSTTNASTPVTPCNITNAVAIACGQSYTSVLLADGTMRTWGAGSFGQLGTTRTADMSTAVTPCNISNAVAIACGNEHTSALLADGTMRTWGSNGNGRLGYAGTINQSSAITPCNISNIAAIACGGSNTAVILADSTMRTWGNGGNGRLGIGTIAVDMSRAVTPCNVSNVLIQRPMLNRGIFQVSQFYNRCGTLFDDVNYGYNPGSVPAMGIAVTGVTGAWEILRDGSSVSIPISGVSPTSALLVRMQDSIRGNIGTLTFKAWNSMTTTPGTLSGVNTNVTGATIAGYAFSSETMSVTPTFLKVTYTSIACGYIHTSALLADGTMRTWGANLYGQLGIRNKIDMSRAVTPCNISNAVAIACGDSYTAALLEDGTMRTWGYNGVGQLGISNTIDMSTAVTPCNISNAIAIACGQRHTAALLADGTMRIWGFGSSGQLGDNTFSTSVITAVTPCNISNAVAIACGQTHTAALLADGTMRTWGDGSTGQLGAGTYNSNPTPVTPCNISNAVAIACGESHTAALLSDGTMRTWGYGLSGRLGIGNTTNNNTAVTPCNISNAVAIACSQRNTAALLADGTMRAWGSGGSGSLGIRTINVDMSTAVTPCNISNAVAIACGGSNTAALLADGTMRTWGYGANGQLGIGGFADMSTAVTPCNISNVAIVRPSIVSMSGMLYNNFPLNKVVSDLSFAYQPGTISMRGLAIIGATGTWEVSINSGSSWAALDAVSAVSATLLRADPVVRLRSSAAASGADTIIVKAWSGQQATPALLTAGVNTTIATATIQGYSFSTGTITLTSTPIPVPPAPTLISAVGGYETLNVTFSIADSKFVEGYTIDVSGTTYNVTSSPAFIATNVVPGTYPIRIRAYNADLSASAYSNAFTTTIVIRTRTTYRSIACNSQHIAALLADGTMRTWGWNIYGQLGISSNADMSRAVTPCNISNAIAIASGQTHTAALLADGTMITWGYNANGELGSNSVNNALTAITPCNISNAVAIACGSNHTAALLADGTMRTWGLATNGRLGNGITNVNALSAVTTCNISNAVAIACGDAHTAALLADGTMRTWGLGTNGQLGRNSVSDATTAVTPCNISNAVAISCGFNHTAALLVDGSMRTWGAGSFGQLGNTGNASQTIAVTPCNISNAVAIACGTSHTAALIADGTMRTWGTGSNGCLGIGNTTTQLIAVTPCNISNAIAIGCGGNVTAALLADGTMRTWGAGVNGCLGIGTIGVDMSTAVTPCNVSNVAIVRPSIARMTGTLLNNYPLSRIISDVSFAYQPGLSAMRGLAIIGATGTWEVSINSGSSWTALGAVSAVSATLVRGDPAVRLRSTAPASGADTIIVKAWSGQQATPALLTAGVDTTIATATIQGYSFSTGTITLTSTPIPVPPVPTLISAVGGLETLNVTFSITNSTFVEGYTIDVSGTTYNVTSSPANTGRLAPGTYVVKVRAYNADLSASAYSTSQSITVVAGAPTTYRSIGCGNSNTSALLADGTLRMWGAGANGSLGYGSLIDASTAVTPCNISNVISLSTSGQNTAVLLADGTVRIWGAGSVNQLGNGTSVNALTPTTPCNLSNVVALATGGSNTIALLSDGTLNMWGSSANGILGTGTGDTGITPVTPCNISNAVAIACGDAHAAALLADGTMRTWGSGANGRLGIGNTTQQNTAVTPCNISNVVAIACGSSNTAALLADGTVRTWGFNQFGELGIGVESAADMSTAVTPCNISNAIALSYGQNHGVVLIADGTVRTWGIGTVGRLGNNNLVANQSRPITPCNISNVIAIGAGRQHTCVLLADGTMRGFGRGIALGYNSPIDVSTAVTPCNISNVAIVKPSFKVATFNYMPGVSLARQLIDISNGFQPGTTPLGGIAIVGLTGSWQYSTDASATWTAMGAVSAASALVLRGGANVYLKSANIGETLIVKAWTQMQATPAVVTSGVDTNVSGATIQGYSFSAGTATLTAVATPAPAAPTFTAITGGIVRVSGVTFSMPNLRCVEKLELVLGSTRYSLLGRTSPAIITGVSPGTFSAYVQASNLFASANSGTISVTITAPAPITYTSIGCGEYQTGAVLANGTIQAYGLNASSQLNYGTTSNIISFAAGPTYTLALLNDGNVTARGYGQYGQLQNQSNAVAIACGYHHSAVLLIDGTISMRGRGDFGQMGNATQNTSNTVLSTPCNISNAIAIACGQHTTAALLANGTMRMWGFGAYGELGNNQNFGSLVPVTPIDVSNVVAISCGYNHTAALIADGTMRTWGLNTNGQLGNGNTTSQLKAVTPCNISNVVAIACGQAHTAALLGDGTMRMWGAGSSGQLGFTPQQSSQLTPVTTMNVSNAVAIACGAYHTAALLADGTMRTWGENSQGQLGGAGNNNQYLPFAPSGISNISIVKPSFSSNISTSINVDLSVNYFISTTSMYQPGTIPYRGLAIVGTTGTWQYSTNSGGAWTTFGAVTNTSATCIRLQDNVRLKCTAAGVLSVKAWSAQQATPAVVTTGVDTTIATATIQGYSFAAATNTITAT